MGPTCLYVSSKPQCFIRTFIQRRRRLQASQHTETVCFLNVRWCYLFFLLYSYSLSNQFLFLSMFFSYSAPFSHALPSRCFAYQFSFDYNWSVCPASHFVVLSTGHYPTVKFFDHEAVTIRTAERRLEVSVSATASTAHQLFIGCEAMLSGLFRGQR